eukprot:6200055-Pleurochrysis_carterae.AAC.2
MTSLVVDRSRGVVELLCLAHNLGLKSCRRATARKRATLIRSPASLRRVWHPHAKRAASPLHAPRGKANTPARPHARTPTSLANADVALRRARLEGLRVARRHLADHEVLHHLLARGSGCGARAVATRPCAAVRTGDGTLPSP